MGLPYGYLLVIGVIAGGGIFHLKRGKELCKHEWEGIYENSYKWVYIMSIIVFVVFMYVNNHWGVLSELHRGCAG
jgi:hypothetical protein